MALRTFLDIESWLGDLVHPDFLILPNNSPYLTPTPKCAFDGRSNSMELRGLSKYPKAGQRFAAAHEFGHAIFRANIILSPGLGLPDSQIAQLKYRLVKFKMMSEKNGHVVNGATVDLFLAIKKEVDAIAVNSPVLRPFDELFADVVAVLDDGHGDAFAKLGLPTTVEYWANWYQLKNLPKNYRGRDFTINISPKGWLAGDSLQTNSQYVVLDPARSYIWRVYMSRLQSSQRSLFLKAYLAATASEALRIRHLLAPESVEEKNIHFMNSIDREMAKVGILPHIACDQLLSSHDSGFLWKQHDPQF